MLDAKKCSSKLSRSIIDDTSLCQAPKDIHSSTAHEKSSLRIVQRFQRNFVGTYYKLSFYSHPTIAILVKIIDTTLCRYQPYSFS